MHTSIGEQLKFIYVFNTPNQVKENIIQGITSENQASQYFTLNELASPNYNKEKDFPLFHVNINTLQYHFDELQTFLSTCSIDFQIICVFESRLKTGISTTSNVQLPGINFEDIPTKLANGGALLYIKDDINYSQTINYN